MSDRRPSYYSEKSFTNMALLSSLDINDDNIVNAEIINIDNKQRLIINDTKKYEISLDKYIHSKDKMLTHTEIAIIFKNILKKIQLLHQNDILHLNILPSNIFIGSNLDISLNDYSCCKIDNSHINKCDLDKINIYCPEYINLKCSSKSDVYLLGNILWYLNKGSLLVKLKNNNSLLSQINTNNTLIKNFNKINNVSVYGLKIIKKCMAFNVDDRLTFNELLLNFNVQQLSPHIYALDPYGSIILYELSDKISNHIIKIIKNLYYRIVHECSYSELERKKIMLCLILICVELDNTSKIKAIDILKTTNYNYLFRDMNDDYISYFNDIINNI